MADEKMPPLAEATEAVEPKEFNHDEHMAKIQSGLETILASEDINEIKQIAQSLLSEEQSEEKIEVGNGKGYKRDNEMSLEDYIGGEK